MEWKPQTISVVRNPAKWLRMQLRHVCPGRPGATSKRSSWKRKSADEAWLPSCYCCRLSGACGCEALRSYQAGMWLNRSVLITLKAGCPEFGKPAEGGNTCIKKLWDIASLRTPRTAKTPRLLASRSPCKFFQRGLCTKHRRCLDPGRRFGTVPTHAKKRLRRSFPQS